MHFTLRAQENDHQVGGVVVRGALVRHPIAGGRLKDTCLVAFLICSNSFIGDTTGDAELVQRVFIDGN